MHKKNVQQSQKEVSNAVQKDVT